MLICSRTINCFLNCVLPKLPWRSWTCPKDTVKCASEVQCVHVAHLCNGHKNCLDGSDETVLKIGTKKLNNCSQPLSPCIAISDHWWLDQGREGLRCGQRKCLDAVKACDGRCDCEDDDCIDENPDFCRDKWQCSPGMFKCQTSGRCIFLHQVCDGSFDCVSDSSDESNCPCDEAQQESVYFRPLLVPLLSVRCSAPEVAVDAGCLTKSVVTAHVVEVSEADNGNNTVWITLADDCGLRFCNFTNLPLDVRHDTPVALVGGGSAFSQGGKLTSYGYVAEVLLPLVARGFIYKVLLPHDQPEMTVNHDDDASSREKFCHLDKIMSPEMSHRIFAWQLLHSARSCDCDFANIGRVKYFNVYYLPSPSIQDMPEYFYDKVYHRMGQFELLFTNQSECFFDANNAATNLNDFFPSVIYGAGQSQDHKNYPVKLFLYQSPSECSSSASEAALSLLTTLAFGASGHMQTAEKGQWRTVDNGTLHMLEKIVCDSSAETFEYEYSLDNVTYLVICGKNCIELEFTFAAANQRFGLYTYHRLNDRNFTKTITVIVKSVGDGNNITHVGNANLYHELFVQHGSNTSLKDLTFTRLYLPRDQRDYVQTSGVKSLDQSLRERGIATKQYFLKVCSDSQQKQDCVLDPLEESGQIEKALAARWSIQCLRVRLANDSYDILRSQADTYFVMVNLSSARLVQDKSLETGITPKVKVLPGALKPNKFRPQTKLVELQGSIYCSNSFINTYRSFYVPTLVSALIGRNEECVKEVCQPKGIYFEDAQGRSFLGPFYALWKSSCFQEFGYDLIRTIYDAEERGLLTVNKFWAFENFNYMVFSARTSISEARSRQVESVYLSDWGFALEVALGVIMAFICLVTVFGNLLVFFAILIDPTTNKSVYQYFQMSLCLADVLMGLAGAGGIVYTQFALLFGGLNIFNFIEENAFVTTFENPLEARRSGLNQFYFVTDNVSFVVCGALVR